MTRALLFLLSLVGSLTIQAELQWQTDPDTALALARDEGKLLLIYYRVPAREKVDLPERIRAESAMAPPTLPKAPEETDRTIADMTRDELFLHALDAFTPLWVEAYAAKPHRMLDALRESRESALLITDPSGTQLALFQPLRAGWKSIAEDVLRFRSVRTLAARSAEHRFAADTAGADFLLGYVLRDTLRHEPAVEAFTRAAEAYAKAGNEESEQLARLAAAASKYVLKQRKGARLEVAAILADPASPAVEAEANLTQGGMLEAESSGDISFQQTDSRGMVSGPPRIVPRALAGQPLQRVLEHYRKAYELAPPGSGTEATARLALMRLDKSPLPAKQTADSTLRIVPPGRATLTGRAEFLVEAPKSAARVDFLLDGEPAASKQGAPFRATIDVGAVPRLRVLRARAYDRQDKPLGEAQITINDRLDSFFVTVVNPISERIHGRTTAEVDVRVPPGRALSDVVLSWNGTPVATLTEPPFRAVITADPDALGYLHAKATLDDGTAAEVTRVYNAKLMESVDVGAVTVLASVSDGGEPVRGLTAADFTIADEGQRVEHDLLSGDDDPVTIGIAIDSSSSMRGRQIYAVRAAATFLRRAMRPQDQAFLVAFDNSARLVHERSGDVDSLRTAVLDLMPAGGTSLFDGVTFALQQFQGIPGRKALIVISDGREGASGASARECERLARSVGVPIHLFVPPGGERNAHALREISQLTGGTMLHAIPEETFAEAYDELANELRAQYVLQFRMPAGVESGAWRTIRVTVPERDVRVRTIAGYRAN